MEKDALTEFEEKLKSARSSPYSYSWHPWAYNHFRLANSFEKLADELTDDSRKKKALEGAAEEHCCEGDGVGSGRFRLRHYERALAIYKEIDLPENEGRTERIERIEKIKKALKKEYGYGVESTIRSLAVPKDKLDLFDLQKLPENLEKAGYVEQAKKYRQHIEEIVNLAISDVKNLK